MIPVARREGLVIRSLADETLVYDETTMTAHCLTAAVAHIWQQCDGRTPIESMAAEDGLDFVSQTLTELDRVGLVTWVPASAPGQTVSRRQVLTRLGAAMAAPVILSVAAPAAAQASSFSNHPGPGASSRQPGGWIGGSGSGQGSGNPSYGAPIGGNGAGASGPGLQPGPANPAP
jgi:hypothetical protein